jgi:hypothetical protein
MAKRGISPLTTWHSQGGVLMISFSWGASYLVPASDRIAFSEVFPESIMANIIPKMWVWGLLLCIPALLAFLAERQINRDPIPVLRHDPDQRVLPLLWLRIRGAGRDLLRRVRKGAWLAVLTGHITLAGVFSALACAALAQGIEEVAHLHAGWHMMLGMVSALSRPILWGYIGYLHSTYARLPKPELPDEELAL